MPVEKTKEVSSVAEEKKTEMQNAKGFRHLLDFPFEKKNTLHSFLFLKYSNL
jgi:hypothetical protein